jgi:UDP-N-acetylmuramoylalanine--D-glutamate ligase
LRGKRVAVWGTGREGTAAVKAIAPVGAAELFVVQDKATFLATDWDTARAPLFTGEDAHDALLRADVVVRSPVIGESHPWIVELRAKGTTITGGTALWMADHAEHAVGVTGSKGKSTTASLISHLLTALGRPNLLGGNIGIAVLDLPPAEQYVLELSMYQCADLQRSPAIAAVTSLFPEHLDWTRDGDVGQYYAHKLNLVEHGARHVVYNANNERLRAELAARPGLPLVGTGEPSSFHVAGELVCLAGEALFPRAALPLVGRHNGDNLCVALGVLQSAGVDCVAERAAIAAALGEFQPLEHRLTPIEDPSGITFVDDSISTIPQSAIHAIEAYAHRPLTVIVGGEDRGIDYTPLRDFLAERAVTATLIGIPDSGPRILDVVKDLPTITTHQVDDLAAAVRLSRELTPTGGVVLLSPAAPSYGRFDNFEHRSRVFRQAIADSR